jgi:epimerase transport system membrane fusion protein
MRKSISWRIQAARRQGFPELDRLLDSNTHQPYYLVKVNVDRDAMSRLAPNVKLIRGMPAGVLIITGHRTIFDYLFQPFLEVFRRSFHKV